jgi:hypothetical protein
MKQTVVLVSNNAIRLLVQTDQTTQDVGISRMLKRSTAQHIGSCSLFSFLQLDRIAQSGESENKILTGNHNTPCDESECASQSLENNLWSMTRSMQSTQ